MPRNNKRVWLAIADAADTQARVRQADGASAEWVDGGHLFAAAIPNGRYSRAQIIDHNVFDASGARAWFAERGEPFAVVASKEQQLAGTRHELNVVMETTADDLRHGTGYFPTRRATSADLKGVLTVDKAAFGSGGNDAAVESWIAAHLDTDDIVTGVVEVMGSPVATGYVVLSDGRAGRTGHIGGIAVVPMMKRRGLGAAITTWLADYAFASGCDLVNLFVSNDEARRLYTRVGFSECGAFHVWTDLVD